MKIKSLIINVVILLIAVLIAALLIWLFPEQCSVFIDWKNASRSSIVKWTAFIGAIIFGILLIRYKIRFGKFHYPYSVSDKKDNEK